MAAVCNVSSLTHWCYRMEDTHKDISLGSMSRLRGYIWALFDSRNSSEELANTFAIQFKVLYTWYIDT